MKGILLASSGIDSPVAGQIMKEKGIDVTALHFVMPRYVNPETTEVVKKLFSKIGIKEIILADHEKFIQEAIEKCNRRLICVLCKRMMFRVAERIAKQEKFDFIISGENLAQVASQTLTNMENISRSVDIEIVRPLLCLDKEEIITKAKEIGTFEISTGKMFGCLAVPEKPATMSSEEVILREETKLDIDMLVDEVLEGLERVIR